jgi:hypothetical protein
MEDEHNTDNWCYDKSTKKTKYLRISCPNCYSVNHTSHMYWPRSIVKMSPLIQAHSLSSLYDRFIFGGEKRQVYAANQSTHSLQRLRLH